MVKDLRYFADAARDLDVHCPMASATAVQFGGAKKQGLGGKDIAAVYLRNVAPE